MRPAEARLRVQLNRRGFNPAGGGCVRLSAAGSTRRPLPPLQLAQPPQWAHLRVATFSAGRVPEHVAARMGAAASAHLRKVRAL